MKPKSAYEKREAFIRKFRSERPHIFTHAMSDGSYFGYCWQQGYDAGVRAEKKRVASNKSAEAR